MSVINYTDIHCHIIPGVDDGAQSMEQAQEMIQIAYESGTRNIIATPHYGTHRAKASKGTIAVNFLELQMWMQANYPDMKLYLGQELSYKHGTEDALKRGAAFTLAGSRYALVEFEPEEEYSRIRDGLQAIQMAGYWPILAHAERCNRLAANVDYIEELVHMGVYIQVNARSITGENGWQCKSCTKKLLKYEWIHFIASDGHDTKKRIPVIQKAYQHIARRYGKSYAERLVSENQNYILTDTFFEP